MTIKPIDGKFAVIDDQGEELVRLTSELAAITMISAYAREAEPGKGKARWRSTPEVERSVAADVCPDCAGEGWIAETALPYFVPSGIEPLLLRRLTCERCKGTGDV